MQFQSSFNLKLTVPVTPIRSPTPSRRTLRLPDSEFKLAVTAVAVTGCPAPQSPSLSGFRVGLGLPVSESDGLAAAAVPLPVPVALRRVRLPVAVLQRVTAP